MPLTYSQTNGSSVTASSNTISFSSLDYVPDINDTIEVYNDTTQLAENTDYTLDTINKNIVFVVTNNALTFTPGTTISVYRKANTASRQVDFQNASVLTEADLDNSALQTFHVAQEALDTAELGITADADGTFDANNKRIKNVLDPQNPQDVATKAYVDGGSDVQTVAGLNSEIALLGTSAMATATTGHIPVLANVVEQTVNYTVTVSSSKFNIQGGEYGSATETPALTLIRGYTYVFDVSDSSVAGHPLVFMNGSSTLGTSDGVTTTGTAGQAGAKVTVVVSDSVTITKYSCSVHGDTMGNTITLRHDDFKEVADIASNVTTVAGVASSIPTVAGINSEITTVANSAYKTDIETVADSTYKAKVETVADSTYKAKVETVADSTYKAKVETVAGDTTAINSIHTNISQVTTFADTYHPAGTTEPSGSNVTEGDLWFDTANDVLKVYDGSSWASASSSIATVASQNEFTASDGQGTDSKYFALNHDVGLELVFLNGVRLKRGSDYYSTTNNTSETAIASGNAATFVRLETVPGSSDILSVMAFGQIANNLAVNTAGGTFTGGVTFEAGTTHNTGSNTFTMPTTRGLDNYVLTRDDSIGTGGTTWKETITQPSITSVSGEINEDTNTTLTVTGTNLTTGMTVKLINSSTGADITGHTALSYSGASSPITVTIPSATTNITPGLQVKLHISKSGLTATSDAITVSEDPNWSTSAGNLAEIYDNFNAGGTTPTVFDRLTATAGAGGGTLIYANDDSSLDSTYFSIASSTGIITTTATALTGLTGSGDVTENFNANAKIDGDTTKNAVRAFNIIIRKLYTYATDILVVGGGGGSSRGTGSGGSGGGGMVYSNSPINLTRGIQYTVEVGTGGAVASSANTLGSSGNDSIFGGSGIVTVTAKGGGHGAKNDGTSAGDADDGGSGGGAAGATVNGSDSLHGVSNQGTFTGYTSKGNRGGTTTGNTSYIGSGGGGAGYVGSNSTTGGIGAAGNGGNGFQWSIDGVTYAGGGGGGTESSTSSHRGLGGTGGGGNGGISNDAASGGTDGLGGGAGGVGASAQAGGNGGSGIIKLKLNLANHTPTITTSSGVTFTEDTSTYSGFNMVTISVAGSSQWIKFT